MQPDWPIALSCSLKLLMYMYNSSLIGQTFQSTIIKRRDNFKADWPLMLHPKFFHFNYCTLEGLASETGVTQELCGGSFAITSSHKKHTCTSFRDLKSSLAIMMGFLYYTTK